MEIEAKEEELTYQEQCHINNKKAQEKKNERQRSGNDESDIPATELIFRLCPKLNSRSSFATILSYVWEFN